MLTSAGRGPRLASRPALVSILPLLAMAFCALALASIVNLLNTVQAAFSGGSVMSNGDDLNVLLGLFGFLVPVALAMSARSLPMYAGLEAFPPRILRPSSIIYLVGLTLAAVGTCSGAQAGAWAGTLFGLGLALMGAVILVFIGVYLWMMRSRGKLPERVSHLAPQPGTVAASYKRQVAHERHAYGPFVGLVASAYLWAMLGGLLLVSDGIALAAGGAAPFALDAIRHSFACAGTGHALAWQCRRTAARRLTATGTCAGSSERRGADRSHCLRPLRPARPRPRYLPATQPLARPAQPTQLSNG